MQLRQHVPVGIAVGLVTNYVIKWFIKDDMSVGIILSVVLGAIGGALPDKIEPATSIWHRKEFHSVITFIVISAFTVVIFLIPKYNSPIKTGILILLLSYLSHLIMDSRTTAGLPLWNRYMR